MGPSRAQQLALRRELLVLNASRDRWRLVDGLRRLRHESEPKVLLARAIDRVGQRPSIVVPLLFRLAWLLYKRHRRQQQERQQRQR